jgi:ankyrin repeat protein
VVLRWLLEHGNLREYVNRRLTYRFTDTVLSAVCAKNDSLESVKLLVEEAGAVVTPMAFHRAVLGCNAPRSRALLADGRIFENARYLLTRGVDIDCLASETSLTTLQIATHVYEADEVHVATTRFLLENGANPNTTANRHFHKTPLMGILAMGNAMPNAKFVIQLLAQYSDLSIKDDQGLTAYDYSLQMQYPESIRHLLKPRAVSQPP